jgi:NAD(P)-dependent dehydrogenase (short-subunit alcohol dehydrogenase family)
MLSALGRGDRVIATVRSLDKTNGFPVSENLRVLQLDVTDSEVAIKTVVVDAIAVWGCIDVLVNNAGIGIPALLEEGG